MAVSRDELFKARLTQREVEVSGLGTFTIRALSRQEVLDFRKLKADDGGLIEDDPAALERAMVSAAMVDPKLTSADVGRWQAAASVGEMDAVTDAIAELSGMNPGAGKEAVKRFRD